MSCSMFPTPSFLLDSKMPIAERTLIDRLDKPSAYYLGRVSCSACLSIPSVSKLMGGGHQNKKRRYGGDEEIGRADAEPDDPLKDATTLYVGNL